MLHFVIFSALFLILIVALYNFFTAPRLEDVSQGESGTPRISILIPARNEQANIKKCLDSVFLMDHEFMEVIVCDDESDDSTALILEEYRKKEKRLKVLSGGKKPEGWTGKTWACQQLFKESRGEFLLFLDADVSVSKDCLDGLVSFVNRNEISLLSCFPFQVMDSPGEMLVVPLMNWILLSLLPLRRVYVSPSPALAAANGQFMLFKRQSYEKIGGHEAVRDTLAEDIAMSRLLKASNDTVMTCLSLRKVSCRMYHGFAESVKGLSRSFFSGANMPGPVFGLFLTVLFGVFFLPFILVFKDAAYIYDIFLIICIRALIAASSGQNIIFNIAIHPIQMVLMLAVGVISVRDAVTGNAVWKGRKV